METSEFGIKQCGQYVEFTGEQVEQIETKIIETFRNQSKDSIETTSHKERCSIENKLALAIREDLEKSEVANKRDGKGWNVIVGSTFTFSGNLNNAAYAGFSSNSFNIFVFRT